VRLLRLLSITIGALGAASAGAKDIAPAVQVLIPGFEVFELPVQLPNLNNLRYRADGKLYALGYNGNIWLLKDTNGDGLEDASEVFFENKAQLRGPIGMAVVPAGHVLLHRDGALVATAQGVIVASKGKVSALLDFDGDDVAEEERVIASGWQEIPPNVDTIGVAVHPGDGSIYFGLGTAAYDNAYLLDPAGNSAFDLASERGTIQRIKPDLSGREPVCTGVRFTIGMEFNQDNELFATDQEGATWLANGNPFDELLHIRPGRHYGFPPRHPRHLPRVFDEPSLFDYGPQHQSTCGFVFNLPRARGDKTFGPADWIGDAFVTGESRGKLFRTKLVRTEDGEFVAANEILACLSMLAVDCTLTPNGGLLVCCHSGGPDWGTGPGGEGKIFLIRPRQSGVPRPIATWVSGTQEVRMVFDRPLDPARLTGLAGKIEITANPDISAGDRFETLKPGYEVVQRQSNASRRPIPVYSASVTADRRTLILATDRQTEAVRYAVRLPGLGRESEVASPGALPQEAAIDVEYSLAGVQATWEAASGTGTSTEPATPNSSTAVLPHLDFAMSRKLRSGEPDVEAFTEKLALPGTLTLATRLVTDGLFLPITQPGSTLDYELHEDQWLTARRLRLRSSTAIRVRFRNQVLESTAQAGVNGLQHALELDLTGQEGRRPLLEVTVSTGGEPLGLHAEWLARFQDGTSRSGPLPLRRMLVPWATRGAQSDAPAKERAIAELAGASWGHGRHVFHSEEAACARCHIAHGAGGTIGPDLSNLIYRDYESVLRDIRHPSFAINPDYITYTVLTSAGIVLTGAIRSEGDQIRIGDASGNTTVLSRDDIDEINPAALSVMPDGLTEKLSDAQVRDLLSFLLLPPPHMPRDSKESPPARRTRDEVAAAMAGAPEATAPLKPLRLLLVAGPQDHGPGEHDYPAWLRVWSQLLAAADGVTVDSAMNWPTADQLQSCDTMLLYQKGDWTSERAEAIDAHLAKGGGLILIHWAIEGGNKAADFARQIGLASDQTRTKYRHGAMEVDWGLGGSHPIGRNFSKLSLRDESYWNLVGDPAKLTLLAVGGPEAEEVKPPLFWTVESNQGRVFVSVPGHYSWTFDDPLYRIILLRAIAWASHEPVDRFNDLVPLGVEFAASARAIGK
jgi:putative heme-binding domain-containing protein